MSAAPLPVLLVSQGSSSPKRELCNRVDGHRHGCVVRALQRRMQDEGASFGTRRYFQGERREMLSIFGVSVTMKALVVAFFLSARDGFARGLMVAVLASATVLSGAAISLLVRDSKLSESLVGLDAQGARQPPAKQPSWAPLEPHRSQGVTHQAVA
jgi:hypothetical protein